MGMLEAAAMEVERGRRADRCERVSFVLRRHFDAYLALQSVGQDGGHDIV